jgi:type II secretory pathway predicted ATPase ExeA
MDAFEHFGFERPPFDPIPDVEFFYEAPPHAETLATLQYVVFANKGCCVVVGESGCGKTLLARIVAASAGARVPVLWVHGGGQPDNGTRLTVYPRGRFGQKGGGPPIGETTLSTETHTTRFLPDPPLLIVDCADELPAHGWRDVLGWLSNEIRYPKPANVLLFGLPRLLEALATPELVRLQRRIFRVCRLEPLSPQLTREYIHARSAAAGGQSRYIFNDATIAQIGELAQGNPAVINQLCDNALLEAYSEGRDYVAMADVENALHTTFAGRLREYLALPPPASTPFARPALPPVQVLTPHYPSGMLLDAPGFAEVPPSEQVAVELEDSIEIRLNRFEERLSHALRLVRQLCDHEAGADRDTPVLEGGLRPVTWENWPTMHPVPIEAQMCR